MEEKEIEKINNFLKKDHDDEGLEKIKFLVKKLGSSVENHRAALDNIENSLKDLSQKRANAQASLLSTSQQLEGVYKVILEVYSSEEEVKVD